MTNFDFLYWREITHAVRLKHLKNLLANDPRLLQALLQSCLDDRTLQINVNYVDTTISANEAETRVEGNSVILSAPNSNRR